MWILKNIARVSVLDLVKQYVLVSYGFLGGGLLKAH